MSDLFSSFKLQGGLELKNRIIMAPLTRSRAPGDLPNERMALYYAQRSTAGLIVSEGVPISPQARGVTFIPGLYTAEQVESWKMSTNSVHDAGGKIFAQLWHVGRVSHTSIQDGGGAPVSCTAQIAKNTNAFGYKEDGTAGFVPASKPRAMSVEEIEATIGDYAHAAENAVKANFDGVEIHGANGYLIDQFMNPLVNDRKDKYGAQNMEDRLRFTLAVVDAVIARIGRERTGIRLSPYVQIFDMPLYDGIDATFTALAKELAKRKLAYVHFMDHSRGQVLEGTGQSNSAHFDGTVRHMRAELKGTPIIIAGSLTRERAEKWIKEDIMDLPAFGRAFIANPDLPARLLHNWPLASVNGARLYGGGGDGYIDYPPYYPPHKGK